MKNSFERSILILSFCLAMMASFAGFAGKRPSETERSNPKYEAGSVEKTEIGFNDISELDLFEAYYCSDGESAVHMAINDSWIVDAGKLRAKNPNGYTSLIFKDYGFLNYEMEVDYQSDGLNQGYLAILSKIRKKGLSSRGIAAEAYKEYATGVFVRDNGNAVLQGDFRSIGLSNIQGVQTASVANYDNVAVHTLKIRVYNDRYQVSVDGNLLIDYVGGGGIGFMGIQSVNNGGSFDNLSLTYLDNSGNPADIMPKDDVIRVAAVGDSLTFGSSNGYYDINDTTPGQLQDLLGDHYEVRNFGLGGRTAIKTSGSCIMNDAEYELAKSYHADLIYIMLGTNDSQTTGGYWGAENETQELVGAQLFKDGYQEIIDGLLADNPEATIYLVVSPSFRHEGLPQLTEAMIAKRARVYTRVIAEDNGFTVIDANEVTKDLASSHLFDLIHYDPLGYGLIANAIFDQIARDKNETPVLPYGLLDENCLELYVGQTYELGYSTAILPQYQSSNEAVVTIDPNGTMTASGVGMGIINATVGSNVARMKVVVKNLSTVSNLTVSAKQVYFGQGMPTLSADTNTKGNFSFADDINLTIGTNEYAWVFTPENPSYSIVTGTVSLTIKKGTPVLEDPVISVVEYHDGLALSEVELPERCSWVEPETLLALGKIDAVLLYTPEDAEHYETVTRTVELTVRLPLSAYDQPNTGFVSILLGFGLGVIGVLGGSAFVYFIIKNQKKRLGGAK